MKKYSILMCLFKCLLMFIYVIIREIIVFVGTSPAPPGRSPSCMCQQQLAMRTVSAASRSPRHAHGAGKLPPHESVACAAAKNRTRQPTENNINNTDIQTLCNTSSTRGTRWCILVFAAALQIIAVNLAKSFSVCMGN